MKTKIFIIALSFVFWQIILLASTAFSQEKDVSDCTKNLVTGGLPTAVSIPQNLCVDEKKAADAKEKVKIGDGRKNRPNQTVNRTNLVYGGMQSDLIFDKLPKEIQQIIKLTFPDIASDAEQLFLLTITAEKFPETGKTSALVKNYQFSLQAQKNKNPPKMPTWTFIRQGGKLRLENLEILNWDAAAQTYQ